MEYMKEITGYRDYDMVLEALNKVAPKDKLVIAWSI